MCGLVATEPGTPTLATCRTLARRHITHPETKEANRVDDRATGLADFSNADRLLVTYAEPHDLTWDEVLALARQRPLGEVAEAIGRSTKRTQDVLFQRAAPRVETRRRLLTYVSRLAR